MKLKSNCQACGRELKLLSELSCGKGFMRSYACGHTFFEPDIPESLAGGSEFGFTQEDFTSITGTKKAFVYQQEGIEFIFKTNFNCLIADPMGLGKTIQALLAAKLAKKVDGTPRFKAILVLVKSATTYQWFEESREWFSSELWSCFRINGTKAFIPPGFQVYVLSMDTLSRFMKAKNGGLNALQNLGIDLVIVDECHSFKNPDSARSQALVAFLQGISNTEIQREITLTCNVCKPKATPQALQPLCGPETFNGTWTETAAIKLNLRQSVKTISYRHESKCPKCSARIVVYQDRLTLEDVDRNKGLIMLSGTPIKNRAEEYFVPLNLLRPDIFTNLANFQRRWLDKDEQTGKYNRIKPYMLEEFRKVTANFIIRREKNEVLSLPPFRRTFESIFIEDDAIKATYNQALHDLDKLTQNADKLNFFDVQESLMTLRRITGIAKIPFAVEYIDTFLDTTENEKIAIGIHHEAVRDGIYHALKTRGIQVLKLSGEDSAEQKNRIVKEFTNNPNCRVLIVNMIAGGVGLNLQCCNNVLVLERQWNAADEEQFECRFNRQGQTLPVLAEYMLAAGTIDTYFAALVEKKRQICGETLDGWDFTQDPNALRDLIEKTLSSKL